MQVKQPQIGQNVVDSEGLQLVNPTAAANNAQQYSPPLSWQGNGYNASGQGSSVPVEFLGYAMPVQQTGTPTGYLVLAVAIGGGTPAPLLQLASGGQPLLVPAGAGIAFTGNGPNEIQTASGQVLALVPGSGGAVGINTTTPGGILDVAGGQVALDNGDYGQERGIRFRNTTDTATPIGGEIYQANDDDLYLKAGKGNLIYFRDSDGSTDWLDFTKAPQVQLRILAGGVIKPKDQDSTSALQITDYNGDEYVNFDSTNRRVSIGYLLGAPKSALHLGGGLTLQAVNTSANYAMTVQDCIVLATGGTGGITVTLPAASTSFGFVVHIKKIDSGAAVTVAAAGTDKIEGASSAALSAQYNSLTLIADGTDNWYKVAST